MKSKIILLLKIAIGGFVALVIIVGLVGGIKGLFSSSIDTPSQPSKPEQKDPMPAIKVFGAKERDGTLTITTDKQDYAFSIITGDYSKKPNSTTKVTVNDTDAKPLNDYTYNYFSYSIRLNEGVNDFNIKATNNAGTAQKQLKVTYQPKPATSVTVVDDDIFEAEISCKQYAEKQLKVKDINVSYDQSSIKRKNADGTIIIKANIADSQGWLHPEKPLGIMECTTDTTGMQVISFSSY